MSNSLQDMRAGHREINKHYFHNEVEWLDFEF